MCKLGRNRNDKQFTDYRTKPRNDADVSAFTPLHVAHEPSHPPMMSGLQSIASCIAKVADGSWLLSARSASAYLRHRLIVVTDNRR